MELQPTVDPVCITAQRDARDRAVRLASQDVPQAEMQLHINIAFAHQAEARAMEEGDRPAMCAARLRTRALYRELGNIQRTRMEAESRARKAALRARTSDPAWARDLRALKT